MLVVSDTGVLLMAKKAGYVKSVAELIEELESRAGFFVAQGAKQIILEAAGEVP